MRWRILGKPRTEEKLSRQEEIFKIIFKNRGLTSQKQRQDFLDPPRPSSFSLRDLKISEFQVKKALLRVKEAIKEKEEIIVYGDYDADGVCATAILWETLNSLGAKAMPYIPDRVSEGYGLNIDSIKKLKSERPGLGLIITVDHGVTAHEKIDFASSLGIDVIVSDHHQPTKKKVPAAAVVHTTKLSGAGVAWILAREFPIKKREVFEKLELAAIGTVTDLLDLVGPNRSLVKWGFRQLSQTKRLGLRNLFKEAGVANREINSWEVGFVIGPRLNAAGRVGHALDSLRLLCTKNPQRAKSLSLNLETLNRQRQELMKKTAFQARTAWLTEKVKGAKLAFVDGEGWEEGVIGLAASKLVQEFYLPVVVISRGKEKSKASARSVDGFNIIEAIREADNLLIDAGGHPMAAGFTVETKNLGKLKEKLVEIAEQRLNGRILKKTLKVDCEVSLDDLDLGFFDNLQKMAPFGVGNPQPDFVTRNLEVVEARLVGKEKRHLKMTVRSPDSGKVFGTIGFGLAEYYPKLSSEKKIDLAYSLIADDWTGERKLQLRVKDIKI